MHPSLPPTLPPHPSSLTPGYNVTRAMGTMMAKLSPTRGFSAELATAMVIMVCSQYGLPTSSSQCIVGAIVGVGLAEGIMGVNWKFFAQQAASWLGTLFAVGLVTAAIFAQVRGGGRRVCVWGGGGVGGCAWRGAWSVFRHIHNVVAAVWSMLLPQ